MRMCICICHAWHVCGSVASTIYIPSCSEAKWPLCSCKGKGGKLDWCVFGICITVVLYRMSVPQYSLIGYLVSISILKPYRECYLISQTLHIAACLCLYLIPAISSHEPIDQK